MIATALNPIERELRRAEWQNAKSIQNEQFESSLESRDIYAETEAMLCSIDLQSAFALLSGEEQKLVMLRYFRGKTQKETAELLITIHEGKNRQIRRMCGKCGLSVKRLCRIAEHSLMLGDLPVGKWRYLEDDEVEYLYKATR